MYGTKPTAHKFDSFVEDPAADESNSTHDANAHHPPSPASKSGVTTIPASISR